jgi:hypothetical protein
MRPTIDFSRAPGPVRLAVVEHEGAWRVLLDGERFGRFPDRDNACACATELSRAVRNEGREVELLLQDRFGEVRAYEGRA